MTATDATKPTSAAQYEPIRVLAAALFGDVQLQRRRATGELVALKRVELASAAAHRALATQRVVEEDVFAELRTNLSIHAWGGHAHIVAMTDCFADATTVSLVTEFCERGELLQTVNTASNGTIGVARAMRYTREMLSALSFLHGHGVAHRDLSLENVLVDAQDCCQLSDFGMATTDRVVPVTGVGKVRYMAPEVAATKGRNASYDPFRADLWSLGVIVFALVTGQYPFEEALSHDPHFRLLDTLGLPYLLERCEFETTGQEAIVNLLTQLLVVDPAQRTVTAEALLAHQCFGKVDQGTVPKTAADTATDTNASTEAAVTTENSGDASAVAVADKPLESLSLHPPASAAWAAAAFQLYRPTPIDTSMGRSVQWPKAIKASTVGHRAHLPVASASMALHRLTLNGAPSRRHHSPRPKISQMGSPKVTTKWVLNSMLNASFQRKKTASSPREAVRC